jgi:hypothetical protein
MLDLDRYINNCKEVKVFGESIHVLEPNVGMIDEINEIEKDLTKDNIDEKRFQVAMLMINFNREGKQYTEKDLKKLPFEAVAAIVEEISSMRLKAETDPNSESPSQMGR